MHFLGYAFVFLVGMVAGAYLSSGVKAELVNIKTEVKDGLALISAAIKTSK